MVLTRSSIHAPLGVELAAARCRKVNEYKELVCSSETQVDEMAVHLVHGCATKPLLCFQGLQVPLYALPFYQY